jgi:lysyl-tRNA synthetase class 2
MPENTLTIVTDFPGWAAALAQTEKNAKGDPIAKRFECYFAGFELANGYQELTDAREQAERFNQDNIKRQKSGMNEMTADHYLLSAMNHGLPACCGVAIGLERVLMAQASSKTSDAEQAHIHQAWSFPIDRA